MILKIPCTPIFWNRKWSGLGCFRDIIKRMRVEAVRVTGSPSSDKPRNTADPLLICEECGVRYSLYCDNEASVSFARWSLLAQEIITSRHPHHCDRVALDRIETF